MHTHTHTHPNENMEKHRKEPNEREFRIGYDWSACVVGCERDEVMLYAVCYWIRCACIRDCFTVSVNISLLLTHFLFLFCRVFIIRSDCWFCVCGSCRWFRSRCKWNDRRKVLNLWLAGTSKSIFCRHVSFQLLISQSSGVEWIELSRPF